MKRLEISVLLAFLFCALLSLVSFGNECNEIRSSVLRMHILADSDSASDQELKLAVRDRLLELSENIFSDCGSYDEAKAAAEAHAEEMRLSAEEVLCEKGCRDSVSVSVEKSWFPTRTYGEITLPSGIYEAVQVRIGSARGHNWWCVMFPTVCLPGAATDNLETVLTDGQTTIVSSDGYELHFRCVELYEQLMEELRQERSGAQ